MRAPEVGYLNFAPARGAIRHFQSVEAVSSPQPSEKMERMEQKGRIWKFGSSARTRTWNPSVNSRMLYH